MRIFLLTTIFLLAMFVGYTATLLTLMVIDQVQILVNPTPPPKSIKDLKSTLYKEAIKAANKEQLNPLLVFAVIKIESNWNQKAVGTQGELGLMQIHPKWHSGATTNPKLNLAIGSRFLKKTVVKCGPVVKNGLKCYNGGISNKTINSNRRAAIYAQKVEKEYRRTEDLFAWYKRPSFTNP